MEDQLVLVVAPGITIMSVYLVVFGLSAPQACREWPSLRFSGRSNVNGSSPEGGFPTRTGRGRFGAHTTAGVLEISGAELAFQSHLEQGKEAWPWNITPDIGLDFGLGKAALFK